MRSEVRKMFDKNVIILTDLSGRKVEIFLGEPLNKYTEEFSRLLQQAFDYLEQVQAADEIRGIK